MVMKAEPFFAAVDAIAAGRGAADAVLLLSPAGRRFTQRDAERYAALAHLVLLCGRYEGVDERVSAHVATDEISIGDYVLSGGEVPALVVIDAIGRLVPGVVGDEQSVGDDSFSHGLLDHPQYTRPADVRGHTVPDVLMSGHHGEIRRWRRREALRRTWERRPDLVAGAALDADEQGWVREWERAREQSERQGSE
jgi:tRNA (guanine37-N1)-methyltransferase